MGISNAETEVVLLSLEIAIFAVAITLPIAFAIAWILVRTNWPGRTIISAIVHLPLVLPPVVIGYLLLIVLGRNGLLGSWLFETFDIRFVFTTKAAVIAASIMALPLMVRAMRQALEALDARLEETAATLGAGPIKVFTHITAPLLAPGIITAAVLGFARALGEFGATITFAASMPGQTQTLPLALYGLLQTPGGDVAATRLMVISIILALIAVGLSEWLTRRASGRTTQDQSDA